MSTEDIISIFSWVETTSSSQVLCPQMDVAKGGMFLRVNENSPWK